MMIERWTRRIVAMGRSHKWLRPLTLFVLLGLFGGAALAEWTARRSSRAWRAAGERRAAYAQQLSACRERGRGAKHVKREIILGRPTAPHHGWWQRYCPSA